MTAGRTGGRIKIALWTLLLLAMVLLLSGCWSRRELDQIAIVTGLAIDKNEQSDGESQGGAEKKDNGGASGGDKETGPVEVTVQIALPGSMKAAASGAGGSGGGPATYWNLKNTDKSMFSALRHDTHVSDKKLYLAHSEVILFGKGIAEEGIADYLDYALRDPELRPGMLIFVVEDRAHKVLDAPPKSEKLPSVNLKKLADSQKYTSESLSVRIIDFVRKMNSEYTAPIAPLVRMVQESTSSTGGGGGSSVGSSGQSGEIQLEDVSIDGIAVFHKDVMVGEMDKIETRGLLWATDEVRFALLTIPVPGGDANIELLNAKSKMKPEVGEDGKVTMTIRVTGNAVLGSSLTPENLAVPEMMDQMQGEVSKRVEEEIRKAYEKAKSLHADVFGFNEKISGHLPKEWEKLKKDWEQVFQTIELKISVDIKIRDAGGLSKALPHLEK